MQGGYPAFGYEDQRDRLKRQKTMSKNCMFDDSHIIKEEDD